jgi:hypothetical protein
LANKLVDLSFWDEFKGQNFGIHMSFVVDQVLNKPKLTKVIIDQMNNPKLDHLVYHQLDQEPT